MTEWWQGRPRSSARIFDLEIANRMCRYPCQQNHTHDWPVESELDGGTYMGDQGVNVSLPRGATAQNEYREVPAVYDENELLYQCKLCEEILRGDELDGHICPDIRAMMEEE